MARSAAKTIGAIEGARKRRVKTAGLRAARTEWFIKEVSDTVDLTMKKRVRIATEFVKNKVIKNISRPVTKTIVGGRVVVTDRSKPGEFPKADTTQLMKTIFTDFKTVSKHIHDGYVGTPLDYGLILEMKLDRSFLIRTFNEERSNINRLLLGTLVG